MAKLVITSGCARAEGLGSNLAYVAINVTGKWSVMAHSNLATMFIMRACVIVRWAYGMPECATAEGLGSNLSSDNLITYPVW